MSEFIGTQLSIKYQGKYWWLLGMKFKWNEFLFSWRYKENSESPSSSHHRFVSIKALWLTQIFSPPCIRKDKWSNEHSFQSSIFILQSIQYAEKTLGSFAVRTLCLQENTKKYTWTRRERQNKQNSKLFICLFFELTSEQDISGVVLHKPFYNNKIRTHWNTYCHACLCLPPSVTTGNWRGLVPVSFAMLISSLFLFGMVKGVKIVDWIALNYCLDFNLDDNDSEAFTYICTYM